MLASLLFIVFAFGSLALACAPELTARLIGADFDPLAPPTGLMRFALDWLGRAVLAFLAVACLLLVCLGTASAQDLAGAAVDVGPLAHLAIEIVAPIALTVLSTLAAWVMLQIRKRYGLDIDARHRDAVEQGLARAVDYAVGRLEDRIAGGIPLTSESRAVAIAATYAERAIPDAIKHFKIDGEQLAQMVEARLQAVLIDPEHERAGTISSPRVSA
ncbi:hypothetical protein DYI37_11480 [Fulvimarina endophytica]|uniref:Uncharacterized protein n=1 Tax=Fulvimarina endophytica TaxID=2293836 RepID=A0A371X332_9HYPH|nr:hypothetical protein [Fulvimarina endophytica]RFC63619.1 hypothetical protein DYI37_11480 [Fulvimarina endophytica]